MGERPTRIIIELHCSKDSQQLFNEQGELVSKFDKFKVPYASVEWRNQLKNFKANGYQLVKVGSANYFERQSSKPSKLTPVEPEKVKAIQSEIDATYQVKKEISKDEIIAQLSARLEKLEKKESSPVEKVDKAPSETTESVEEIVNTDDLDIEALKIEYVEKFGKKPHHKWDASKILEKLNEV